MRMKYYYSLGVVVCTGLTIFWFVSFASNHNIGTLVSGGFSLLIALFCFRSVLRLSRVGNGES